MGAYDKKIWDYLLGKINNKYGVAGLMGNLYAESGLSPNNLENSYETTSGFTDATYTAAVDNGTYTKSQFVNDAYGYGLAQWTYKTRKQGLYELWKSSGYSSIGNIDLALAFLWYELQNSYPGVLTTLKNATSIREASDDVLHRFENPADQSEAVEEKRAAYGKTYYDKYADSSATVDYSPRTSSAGIEGDFHFYSQNPFYTAGYGMPNCTCYAFGRFWEIADPEDKAINKPALSLGNAGQWYGHTADGYERGTTPKLGAVICWNNPGKAGHVAIVEQILDNGDIVTSNSAWESTFFYMKTYTKAAGYNFSTYQFQGFIYNPFVTTGGGTTPDPDPPDEPDPEPDPEPDWSWITGTKKRGFNWVLFNRQKRRM